MNKTELDRALKSAITASHEVGRLMRQNLAKPKKIHATTTHDIKLELDLRAQRQISHHLRRSFPGIPILGEEGMDATVSSAPARWVVDPIDGTVNFAQGIPHACISIALQVRAGEGDELPQPFDSVIGVIYDPFLNELWCASKGRAATLNGRRIKVSSRRQLGSAVISLGFPKGPSAVASGVGVFERLVSRVRKLRIMGSAGLALAYVACGRFDAYVESGLRLWDWAAGGLIVKCAGGEFWHEPRPGKYVDAVRASNPALGRAINRVLGSWRAIKKL